MIRRLAAVLLLLCFLPLCASGEIAWPDKTPGQMQLKEYISRVNDNLLVMSQQPVNAMFECYTGFATLGITAFDDALTPEKVELTFTLYQDRLNTLQLRVSTLEQFSAIAASCIQAVSPDAATLQDCLKEPERYMKKALKNPANSFEDPVDPLNGPTPRAYYAYYPNQYSDGVNWLQLTLVFPLSGLDAQGGVSATETPPPGSMSYYDDNTETGYEGYGYDGGTHFEVFTTATPEPDSAAGKE